MVGTPLALWSTRFAVALVQGVPPDMPLPIPAAVLVMFTITILSTCVPAYRATRVNPADAPRRE